MPWQQIKARITDTEAEQMEQLFQSLGAVSVSFLDAEDEAVFQLEPGATPLWQQTLLSALFEQETPIEEILLTLKSASRLTDEDLLVETIEDQDWERAWMDEFKPMKFGERLWICPSWTPPPDESAVNVRLDPGLAFGSGTHPTTSLCLEWLDGEDIQGKTVIDYGCGSGILAIAAALLGAKRIIGVDNDPQAVTATENNRQENGISPDLLTAHLPGESHEPADIVIANILSGPLMELEPILSGLTKPGGKLVLSGLLNEQSRALIEAYNDDFDMEPPVVRDGWARIAGTRRAQ